MFWSNLQQPIEVLFNSSLVKVALVPQWSMIKLEVLEQLSHSFVRVIT